MTKTLKGTEPVAGVTLSDFWSWAFSDLTSNTLRGLFAEWLVASACGATDKPRQEWDATDVIFDGIKVEVKSSAYVQSWEQTGHSTPSFTIRRTRAWTSKDGYEDESKRQADVYVFCLLAEKNEAELNPLDTSQWDFYVLATKVLDAKVPDQKSIGLKPLLALGPKKVAFANLENAIRLANGGER